MNETLAQLSESFRQMAFINAVLGGFVFAYLGTLITSELKSVILNYMIGLSVFSAVFFIIVTIVSTLSVMLLSKYQLAGTAAIPAQVEFARPLVLILFFLAIQASLLSLGLAGWLRSKMLGMFSSIAAGIGVIIVIITVVIF